MYPDKDFRSGIDKGDDDPDEIKYFTILEDAQEDARSRSSLIKNKNVTLVSQEWIFRAADMNVSDPNPKDDDWEIRAIYKNGDLMSQL